MATVLWCYLRNPAFKTKEKDFHVFGRPLAPGQPLASRCSGHHRQSCPTTGYTALGAKKSPYRKIDKKHIYNARLRHPSTLAPATRFANCYMGRAASSTPRRLDDNDFSEAIKTAIDRQRRGPAASFFAQLQRPAGRGRGAAARDPGRLPLQRDDSVDA